MLDKLIASPVFNLVDAAGAGAGDAAPVNDGAAAPVDDAAAGAAAPGADAPPAQPDQAAPVAYLPDGLADDFKGATDKETIDKLWAAHQALPKPPATSDAYQLDLEGDTLKGVIAPDDRVAAAYRDIALKHGLTQEQFAGTITELATFMKAEGLIPEPVDLATEFAALSDGRGDRAAQVQQGKQVMLGIADTITGLLDRQAIDAATATELLENVMVSAASAKAVHALIKLLPDGATGPRTTGGQPGGGEKTPDQRLADFYPSLVGKTA